MRRDRREKEEREMEQQILTCGESCGQEGSEEYEEFDSTHDCVDVERGRREMEGDGYCVLTSWAHTHPRTFLSSPNEHDNMPEPRVVRALSLQCNLVAPVVCIASFSSLPTLI